MIGQKYRLSSYGEEEGACLNGSCVLVELLQRL